MSIRRVLPAVLALAALALAVAACGSDEEGTDTGVASVAAADETTSDTAASDDGDDDQAGADTESTRQKRGEAMLDFAQCMRKHGIDVPDPKPGEPTKIDGRGVDRKTMEAANKECSKGLQGMVDDLSPADKQRMRDNLLKFARCMREHGIDLPDPDPNGNGLRIGRDSGIDLEDPAFQKAQKACEPMLRQDGRTGAKQKDGQ